ncbi:MAG: four helix bundle protein [Desulfohalobiaceae bacterium]|nr:four helix bundle protein [Desulfohalobiaceae bacterium]
MKKGDDIQERLVDFAVEIIQVCSELPKNVVGRHIAGQLMRSGTSPAPNYAEARSAESNNDFVHKLKISLKELNETSVWLKIIVRSKLLSKKRVHNVYGECNELCKIISTSIRTVVGKRKNNY